MKMANCVTSKYTPVSDPLIIVDSISKRYLLHGRSLDILSNASLCINAGDACAILGDSGSGKSTLLNILGLLDVPDSGRYYLGGRDITQVSVDQAAVIRNSHIGFVFQGFNLLPHLSALDNVALPLSYRGTPRRNALGRALALLDQVGLAGRATHRPADLSGGQRQRVAIARALVGEPSVILADEPTGNLDSQTAQGIMRLLLALNRDRGSTLIVVTHDPTIAAMLGRHIHVCGGALTESRRQPV